jgi:hypothetical protein
MAFKSKSKNRNPINSTKTLDATHSSIIESFQQQRNNIPNLYKQIEIIKEEIIKYKEEKEKVKHNPIESMKFQQMLWGFDDQIKNLESQITDIKNNSGEIDYLLKTGNILKDYYSNEKPPPDVVEEEKMTLRQLAMQKNPNLNTCKSSVIDYFKFDPKTNKKYDVKSGKEILTLKGEGTGENKNTKDNYKSNFDYQLDNTPFALQINTHGNISKDNDNNDNDNNSNDNNDNDNANSNSQLDKDKENSSKKKIKSKKQLYNEFMNVIDQDFVYDDSDEDIEDLDICHYCHNEMLLEQNTGKIICVTCGIQEQVLIDSDKPSYKDPPKEMTSFCYKRINHLNEFLAQFQAKETTEIPEEVYNEILVEINKERIENMADLTPEKLRALLRKIKRNDYYEHIPYIINQLNGLPPPIISPEVEEIIRSMFKEIQIPFEKFCPKKRKNFLSYNYVMYKFFELLELDEYLDCFQLLKSRNKLHQQDVIWKNICKYTKWQFIPSL